MSSHPHDPWATLPNLSGLKTAELDQTRVADPSRLYASARGGEIDPMTNRILNVPKASVYLNGGGTLATNVVTPVNWDTVEYDTDGMWSSLFPRRLTCKTPGEYRVTSWFTYAASAAGERALGIRKTTTTPTAGVYYYPGPGILNEGKSVNATVAGLYTVCGPDSYDMFMNVGDYVEVYVTYFDVGTLAWIAATAGNKSNSFQATLISTFGSDS